MIHRETHERSQGWDPSLIYIEHGEYTDGQLGDDKEQAFD
jgi:hypothetical protein